MKIEKIQALTPKAIAVASGKHYLYRKMLVVACIQLLVWIFFFLRHPGLVRTYPVSFFACSVLFFFFECLVCFYYGYTVRKSNVIFLRALKRKYQEQQKICYLGNEILIDAETKKRFDSRLKKIKIPLRHLYDYYIKINTRSLTDALPGLEKFSDTYEALLEKNKKELRLQGYIIKLGELLYNQVLDDLNGVKTEEFIFSNWFDELDVSRELQDIRKEIEVDIIAFKIKFQSEIEKVNSVLRQYELNNVRI